MRSSLRRGLIGVIASVQRSSHVVALVRDGGITVSDADSDHRTVLTRIYRLLSEMHALADDRCVYSLSVLRP